MELKGKRILVCDCEGTMAIDGQALAKACAATGPAGVARQLCRAEIETFRAAAREGRPLVVACTQESPLFEETRSDANLETEITYINVRENAGWSEDGPRATPKMAALLAEATLEVPAVPALTMRTEGVCLVYGRDEAAIEAARQLAGRLDVTVLLSRPGDVVPPMRMDLPIFKGTVAAATGHLGAFEIVVDDYAPMVVSSRRSLSFEAARNGAVSRCDLILDLTGGAPLFPAAEKRDGYLNPDPGNPAAVQRALFELADMVGEFEKPRYVDFHAELCAHSRSRLIGCTRCLDACPASAIRADGDVVAIDPFICGGCGSCSSVCPTGAAEYAMPPVSSLLARVRLLLATFLGAGGTGPALLVHDGSYGAEMISIIARFGHGLPANVLPFVVNEVTQIGFDFMAGALAFGATRILLLVPPQRRQEIQGLAAQVGLAETVMTGLGHDSGRVTVLVEDDPDALAAQLRDLPDHAPLTPGAFLPLGGKRALSRLALSHLHATAPRPAELVELPPGAPYGSVEMDTAGCTLCLSCVGACPTGALTDNPDAPQLRFQEDACIQCGLCKNTCPEKVITLHPRISFAEDARRSLVLKEEEPFNCVRCGKPFGTRSSIERILGQLAEKHSMFRESGAIERIKMCEDCRVIDQFEAPQNPLAGGARRPTRTTEDYLRERQEIEAARAAFKASQKGGSEDGDGR